MTMAAPSGEQIKSLKSYKHLFLQLISFLRRPFKRISKIFKFQSLMPAAVCNFPKLHFFSDYRVLCSCCALKTDRKDQEAFYIQCYLNINWIVVCLWWDPLLLLLHTGVVQKLHGHFFEILDPINSSTRKICLGFSLVCV